MVKDQIHPKSRLSIESLNSQVADPSVFCGGGSVAALTGSSAAALVLLVLQLSASRRANRDHLDSIQLSITTTQEIQERLYKAADDDVTVLDLLLIAQREARESGEHAGYHAALLEAAVSPISIATDCRKLLEVIDAQMDRATRFTVSDLGAAAALTQGAVRAALHTSEVNLALLRDEEALGQKVDRLAEQARQIVSSSDSLATRIDERTRAAIHRTRSRSNR